MMLIIGLYDIGDNNGAEEVFTKLKEMYPGEPLIYYTIGRKLELLKRNDQAIPDYRMVTLLSKDPKTRVTVQDTIDSLKWLISGVTGKKSSIVFGGANKHITCFVSMITDTKPGIPLVV